jgi:hypothetical protein
VLLGGVAGGSIGCWHSDGYPHLRSAAVRLKGNLVFEHRRRRITASTLLMHFPNQRESRTESVQAQHLRTEKSSLLQVRCKLPMATLRESVNHQRHEGHLCQKECAASTSTLKPRL